MSVSGWVSGNFQDDDGPDYCPEIQADYRFVCRQHATVGEERLFLAALMQWGCHAQDDALRYIPSAGFVTGKRNDGGLDISKIVQVWLVQEILCRAARRCTSLTE